VATVAMQVNQSRSGHGARGDLVRERKRQVEAGSSVHVDGVQSGVGALHGQRTVLRDEKNVRDVVALFLVQMSALLGQIHGLAAGDVFQIDDGIGHATLGAHDQALQVGGLAGIGIADLRIFGDGEVKVMRQRPSPFDGAGDGAAVRDLDDLIVLGEGGGCGRETEGQKKNSLKCPAHRFPPTPGGRRIPSPRHA
jgi:hypothetical protein